MEVIKNLEEGNVSILLDLNSNVERGNDVSLEKVKRSSGKVNQK